MFDILADEVFRLTGAKTDGPLNGGIAVMCSSNSFPSFTVFNSAWNDLLVHCRSDNVIGSSRLLTIFTILVSLVWTSLETLNTAIVGVTSIGFHTVPLIWRITLV